MQRVKAETKTASGIFLPESSVKELNEAKVLAVGPGGLDKDGKIVSCSVKAGDKVLIPQVCSEPCFTPRDWEWRDKLEKETRGTVNGQHFEYETNIIAVRRLSSQGWR